MFLSIIIPVHNAECYLLRCLDSIWSQGIPADDFEVICVDDCSTDNSLAFIIEQMKNHRSLQFVKNTQNIKAGGSRNAGVRSAKGEYILFIDSDDYFHPHTLRFAYDFQKQHHLDILMLDSSREMQGNPNNRLVHNFKNLEVMTGREFMVKNSLPYAPWKYVFKKSIMVDNNVWFEENVNCEDVDWTHKLAFYANTMQYIPMLLTHYVLLPFSETGAEYKNINTIRNRLFCAQRVLELCSIYVRPAERQYISSVAMNTFYVGLRNMLGSFASPLKKYKIIEQYFIPNVNGEMEGFILNFASCYPYLFSIFSTVMSPFARVYIGMKRFFIGR